MLHFVYENKNKNIPECHYHKTIKEYGRRGMEGKQEKNRFSEYYFLQSFDF